MMSVSYSYEPDRPSENASSSKSMTCSSPDARSRTTMRGSPSLRSSRTRKSLNDRIDRISRPCSCGTRSVQFSRRGSATGAVTILKSLAPSALVRMKKTSPPSSMSYSSPVSRGETSFGSASGSLAGMTRYSDVSWSLMAMKIQSFGAAAADAHEEARIGFLVDQPVFDAIACRAGGRRSSTGGGWRRAWCRRSRHCRRSTRPSRRCRRRGRRDRCGRRGRGPPACRTPSPCRHRTTAACGGPASGRRRRS